MKPVWTSRTGEALSPAFQAFSESVHDDGPFVVHDLAASVAHVLGLHRAGLLDATDAKALVAGLQGLHAQWEEGTWKLDPALEDVHMNIEATLSHLGDAAGRLHTGRSRNDQVATCTTLYARAGLRSLAACAARLSATLAAQAEAHAATPWVARTHGQPAQPATLGFLLAAHAWRVHDLQARLLACHDAIGESALGSGAVAGSTLPLQPAYVASLLGLRPPRNALLATGTRDGVVAVCQQGADVGGIAAGLAEDLLQLFHAGALRLPPGLTTGSSLMPHKRNPDALELVRGHGKALQGPLAAVTAVTQGLGLGYQRDLQTVKPELTRALETAERVLEVLGDSLAGARFDTEVLATALHAPGITATDAAEALVAAGWPFRQAYDAIAKAGAVVESGASWTQAITDLGLPPDLAGAALAALVPDPSERDTPGGPAPEQVRGSVQALHADAKILAARLQAARHGDPTLRLLTSAPAQLVEEAAP